VPKVVLVTGASSGLGQECARQFAAGGCTVYGTSRTPRPDDGPVTMITLDVDDAASCEAGVQRVIDEAGRIDVLVNNAGFGVAGPLELTDDEAVHAQLETNLVGPIRLMRAVLPHMRAAGGGVVVNVGSVAGVMPIPFQSLYAASKAALEVTSQAVGMEVAPFGIKLAVIEFGDMRTGFTAARQKVAVGPGDAYADRYGASVARMEHDEQSGPVPQGAAALVVRTALSARPKPVIVYGAGYKPLVALRRVLPIRLTNWIIGKLYG